MFPTCVSCMEELPRCVRSSIVVWKCFQDVLGLCQLYGGASKTYQVCVSYIEEFPKCARSVSAVWRSFQDVAAL